jgi:alkylation response protein AidB-like acyl-CoA dehydrogenase
MIPLDAPGVTVRPVDRLDGDEGFAEVFLEDVFVPERDILGAVHQGWSVAMATTSSERGLSLRSPGRFIATAERLIALWRQRADLRDARLRDLVVRAHIDAEAYRLHTFQTVASLEAGEPIGPESSINKLFWSEMDVRTHETALSLLGPLAELDHGAPDAVDGGAWLRGYEFALAGPIYAGTNEIQRSIVAQHVLGLPRDRG